MVFTRTQQEASKLTSVLVVTSVVCCTLIVSIPLFDSVCQGSSSSCDSLIGWLSVIGASIVFGTTCIPMKSPQLATQQIDPMLFAFYVGIGIFIISTPLAVYLLAAGLFRLTWWGILGASDIFIINFFAYNAVERLGMAVAPGCWSGIGMITAFVVGTVLFEEPVRHWSSASAAVVLLAGGVYCISTSKGSDDDKSKNNGNGDFSYESGNSSDCSSSSSHIKATDCNKDNSYVVFTTKDRGIIVESSAILTKPPFVVGADIAETAKTESETDADANTADLAAGIEVVTFATSQLEQDAEAVSASALLLPPPFSSLIATSEDIPENSRHRLNSINFGNNSGSTSDSKFCCSLRDKYIIGFLCCFATGLCDGNMMVPFKLYQQQNHSDGSGSSENTSSSSSSSSSHDAAAGLLGSLNYLASFGLLAALASPVLLLLYIATLRRGTPPSWVEFKLAAEPGVASGMLWACANMLSVVGTHFLGMSISFPLTQTCVIFASAWGVVYFDENIPMKRRFAIGILAVLVGSYFLGMQG